VSFLNPFRRRRIAASVSTSDARVPDHCRVYAFGDVHGRADLLKALRNRIEDEIVLLPEGEVPTIVGLGDYIDRGADSHDVIELLRQMSKRHQTFFVKGNHEALLLAFLEDPIKTGQSWMQMGGWETLVSYGVETSPNAADPGELGRIRDEFAAKLPSSHLRLLLQMPLLKVIGDYAFIHAGARPGVPVVDTPERDALWIRSGFADRDEPLDKVVVHGHTPVQDAFVGHHRINLDTGAYATGKLTCMVLEGGNRRRIEVTA